MAGRASMSEIDKRTLTERDICTKFINAALESAGWDLMHQIREQYYFTDGRVMVRGKRVRRGERKFADYLLLHSSGRRLAVIEAKDNNHSVGSGMQQALGYAKTLDVPFLFSSNGDGFLFHNRLATSGTVEQELPLDGFPSPIELWDLYCQAKNITQSTLPIITQPYFSGGREPRYFQQIAIDRTIEAIASGQKRVLLVMATGKVDQLMSLCDALESKLTESETQSTQLLSAAVHNLLNDSVTNGNASACLT